LHDNSHIKKQSALKVCVYGVVDWVKRKVLWKLREYVENYVRDYLVKKFFNIIKAPRNIILAVNTIMTLDALSIIRIVLAKYGMVNFTSWIFWLGLII
jgi:hypothetical protein